MKRDFEVIEASQDLVNSLVPFANDCYSEGITMYKRALDNPQQYLQSLIERSRATEQELLNGLLPSTTYYYLHNHEILGAIRLRRGTNFNVENVIGHIGYETSSLARNKGVASSLLMWVKQNALKESIIITCAEVNVPSQRVIEKCGGEYIGMYDDNDHGKIMRFKMVP